MRSSSIPDFLARNRYFLARKYTEQSREQKSREQYSTVEQTRPEQRRVDITAEQNKIENGEWKMTD